MIDVYLLGTGGAIPLLRRRLSAALIRVNGRSILIDCGEGTQLSLRACGLGLKDIDAICITHFHADHTGGLAGLLLTMADAGRTEPVVMFGPKRLSWVVECLLVIAPRLPFELEFREISHSGQQFALNELEITAFELQHNIPCYGYAFSLSRLPRFMPDQALALGIPQTYWGRLQRGERVRIGMRVFRPKHVLGEARKGLKVVYATDTRPVPGIVQHAKEADLLICEGMYGTDEELEKAKERGHMTFGEAAQLAAEARVKELWLTHYSPSLVEPEAHISATQHIFLNTIAGYDGMQKTLIFQDR